MAFCNSCGTTLEAAAKFCPKCGASVPAGAGAAVPSTTAPPGAPPSQSSSGLKIVLIVLAAVVVLGILGATAASFFAWRIARNTHVQTNGGNVKVETPFGTVESSDNPEDAARNLGIDVYPGAHALKGNAASVSVGGMHTVAAQFETDDPPEKVAEFFKSKLPHASVTVTDDKRYTIVSNGTSHIVINIEAEGGKTQIHVANISGKGVAGSESSD